MEATTWTRLLALMLTITCTVSACDTTERIGRKIVQKVAEDNQAKTRDWQLQQTQLVRQRYEAVRMITIPPLYGFTQQDADQFKNRITEMEMEETERNCRKELPKYTDYKIKEATEILKNVTCETQERQRMRRRRETRMRNRDGSVTLIQACFRRGSRTRNGNLRLCTECHAITILPENVFPRFINEVICDRDNSCLSSSGSCTESFINIPFLRDTDNLGEQRLGEWRQYQQQIRASCACGIRASSPLKYFI